MDIGSWRRLIHPQLPSICDRTRLPGPGWITIDKPHLPGDIICLSRVHFLAGNLWSTYTDPNFLKITHSDFLQIQIIAMHYSIIYSKTTGIRPSVIGPGRIAITADNTHLPGDKTYQRMIENVEHIPRGRTPTAESVGIPKLCRPLMTFQS